MWSEVTKIIAKVVDNFTFNVVDGIVDVVIVIVEGAFAEAGLASKAAYANVRHVATISLVDGVSQLLGVPHKTRVVRIFSFPHNYSPYVYCNIKLVSGSVDFC